MSVPGEPWLIRHACLKFIVPKWCNHRVDTSAGGLQENFYCHQFHYSRILDAVCTG